MHDGTLGGEDSELFVFELGNVLFIFFSIPIFLVSMHCGPPECEYSELLPFKLERHVLFALWVVFSLPFVADFTVLWNTLR